MATDLLSPALHQQLFGDRPVRITARRLRGGLEAAAVHIVHASIRDAAEPPITHRVIRKRSTGGAVREVGVYRELVACHVPSLAPRLLDVRDDGSSGSTLWLEAIPRRRWPWRDLEASARVLERIATLHAVPAQAWQPPAWDYDAELRDSALATLEALRVAARDRGAGDLVRAARRAAEVLVGELAAIRAELVDTAPFGRTVLHGDVHAGNVLHRVRAGVAEPLLVDWARARIGCALEDVSSWLHSLGTWEPEARRRHDTLLVRYLAARGLAPRLTGEVRRAYWLAGASNALAGALRYHLAVARDPRTPPEAARDADRAARSWLRVLRRAHASLR